MSRKKMFVNTKYVQQLQFLVNFTPRIRKKKKSR